MITGLTLVFLVYSVFHLTRPVKTDVLITIPKHSTISKTIEILNKEKIFEPEWYFSLVLKIYGRLNRNSIIAGCYRYKAGTTNAQILFSIFSGKQLYTIKVTFPEGITLKKFASIAAHRLSIDSAEFIDYVNSDSILKANNIPTATAEGYLMPDTYEFYWKQPVEEIVNMLITTQNEIWNKRFAKQALESGKSKHEILTLASIIEAETPVNEEKARVGGVYINRLNIGMMLQSDPTVQYAMGEKKRVLYKYLDVDSPYNTYRHRGLPPGPINSPGTASIEAALFPENNNYLYFVAIGDGSGRHAFSRSAAQHQINVAEYRRKVHR